MKTKFWLVYKEKPYFDAVAGAEKPVDVNLTLIRRKIMSKTEDFLSKADEQDIVQAIIEAEKTLGRNQSAF